MDVAFRPAFGKVGDDPIKHREIEGGAPSADRSTRRIWPFDIISIGLEPFPPCCWARAWHCWSPSMALFTSAIADGCVGLHDIVGRAFGIAAGIVSMMVLRRWRRG